MNQNPKETAKQLFDSMYSVYNMENRKEFEIDEEDNKTNDELWEKNRELFESIYKTFAKESALKAVDAILNTGPLKMIDWGEIISDKPHWEEVKKELEAL